MTQVFQVMGCRLLPTGSTQCRCINTGISVYLPNLLFVCPDILFGVHYSDIFPKLKKLFLFIDDLPVEVSGVVPDFTR